VYVTWYVILSVVFLAGAIGYWYVTRSFSGGENIYLPEAEGGKDS
jgi:hypothetical protein